MTTIEPPKRPLTTAQRLPADPFSMHRHPSPMRAAPVPKRVQLSRAKGWRMPPNTVKVDRSTKWGNPFVVGRHGDAAYCVQLFEYLLGGLMCVGGKGVDGTTYADQERAYQVAARDRAELRGKDLACWCRLDRPCHADVLLRLAND